MRSHGSVSTGRRSTQQRMPACCRFRTGVSSSAIRSSARRSTAPRPRLSVAKHIARSRTRSVATAEPGTSRRPPTARRRRPLPRSRRRRNTPPSGPATRRPPARSSARRSSSADDEGAARRLLRGARMAEQAGSYARAHSLLEAADARTTDALVRADVAHLRANLLSMQGQNVTAARRLEGEAEAVLGLDAGRASRMLRDAVFAAAGADEWELAERLATRACEAAELAADPDPLASLAADYVAYRRAQPRELSPQWSRIDELSRDFELRAADRDDRRSQARAGDHGAPDRRGPSSQRARRPRRRVEDSRSTRLLPPW